MPAIADVARLAGVSKATASRALSGRGYVSDETRLRVTTAAAKIGYIASPNAASLVTGRTQSIGVIIPFVNRWFFGEVLEGVERALLDAKYDLTLYNLTFGGAERDRIFEFFLARKRVDAIIAVSVELTKPESDRLIEQGKPVVAIGGWIPGSTTLTIDEVAAGRLATEHLIHLGHRTIAHIGGEDAAAEPLSVHGQRWRGYRSALEHAGIDGSTTLAAMSMPGGYTAALQVLGDPRQRPTAIFAACDEIAFGVFLAAERLGLEIPRDLSVIGIDGHEYSEMYGLTTVEQFPGDQGRAAVATTMTLLDPRDDTAPPPHTTMPVRLVVRSSTAAPAR